MKPIFLGILFLLLSCSVANSTGINILSEEHHVWGWAGRNGQGETYTEYDVSGNQPVGAEVGGSYYDYSPELELSQSKASAGNFSIDLRAGRWAAAAFGTSSYTFTTGHNFLTLSAYGHANQTHGEDVVWFSLVDISFEDIIFTYSFKPFKQYFPDDDFYDHFLVVDFKLKETLSVIPGHEYLLSMYAETTWGDSPASSFLTCNIASPSQPVPEPATVLLFTLGLVALLSKQMQIIR